MTDRERGGLFVAEFRRWAAEAAGTDTVFGHVAEAVVRELDRLTLEVKRLQGIIEGLAARVATQSELLGRRAERREM